MTAHHVSIEILGAVHEADTLTDSECGYPGNRDQTVALVGDGEALAAASKTAVEELRDTMSRRCVPPCICQKCGSGFYQLWLRTYEERLWTRLCARCAEWPTGIECVWVDWESEGSAK